MSKDWLKIKLSDYVDISIGGTPSRSVPTFWAKKPNGHSWLAISDMKSKYVADTKEYISDLGVRSSNVKLIPSGSTVMSFKLSVGRTAITTRAMYSNEAIAAFLPKNDSIDNVWLYHVLPKIVSTVVTDTAVKGVTLNKRKMAEMSVMLPNLAEQKKIAKILDNFDSLICNAEAIIEKLKLIKQGLLHDLMTRGIDTNGALRPPQSEAPEHYKDSALGWIPMEWKTVPLCEIGEVLRGKFTHRPRNDPAFYGGLFPFIQTGDVAAAAGGYLTEFSQTLSARGVAVSQEFPAGTIAITIAANIADTAILSVPMYFPDSVVGMIVSPAHNVQFVELSIRRAKPKLDARAPQSAQKNINLQDLRPMLIAIPSKHEQDAIASRAESIQLRIQAEEAIVRKLMSKKYGLMEDLLTGRVRVAPTLDISNAK